MQLQSPIFTFQVLFAFLFAPVIFFCLLPSVDSCHPNDHTTLLHFNHIIGYISQPLNWSDAVNCCEWEGISCDQHGRVSHLWLPSRGLEGCIPPSICNLTHLSHLNLSNNDIGYYCDDYNKAILPKDIFTSLSHLEVLDLSGNSFQGEFPSLAKSMSIRILDISFNQFLGEIHVPPQFVAPNLTSFRVGVNKFRGEIPAALCFDSNLHVLDLSTNNFSGMIPHEIAKCSNLRVLNISHNFLSGSLPDHIFNITILAILDLSYNHLRGSIPRGIGKLAYLKELSLSNNHLVDLIPSSLMNCTHVSKIDMRFNNLSGDLSHLNFSNLTNLSFLYLSYNNFGGEFPHSMVVQCPSIRILDLSSNPLLGQNVPNLEQSVKLPGSESLQVLTLRACGLTQIPASLTKSKGLQVIDLSFNKITGPIPSWLGTLPNLWVIDLSSNQISGHIPPELFKLPALGPTSEVPMWDSCSVSSDKCLTYLTLDLIHMNPVLNLAFKRLSMLNLSNNRLNGDIPWQRTGLYYLNILDLSFNRLSGGIPPNQLPSLQQLNVSYNNLQGPIPNDDHLNSFDWSSYRGNRMLCGFPLQWNCSNTKGIEGEQRQTTQAEDNEKELPWFYIGAVFGFLTGFSGICYSFLFSITWREAFFNFLLRLYDQIYVFVAIRVNRFKQK